MLYQGYKQKLSKLTNAFEVVWRFRFLILIALVAFIALFGTLLGITGNVYGESCQETVVYGSEISIKAKAVFRKTSFEYRPKGSNSWTKDKPWQVGKYEVRAVSKGVSGRKKYGKILSFSVLPFETELYVEDDGFVYGDTPTAFADLVYSDEIKEMDFSYNWLTDEICNITAHAEKVVNADGVDVTACYSFITPARGIFVAQRSITISVEGATKTYDGVPLRVEDYSLTEGSLVEGEKLEITFPHSQTDVGEVTNEPVYKILSASGKDVTARYRITLNVGTLKVEPREVHLRTQTAEKIYDGKELGFSAVLIDSATPLADGHRIAVKSYTAVTKVGEYVNDAEVCIYDENGVDVSANYRLVFDEKGTLTILPRPITVRPATQSWVYDSITHS